MADQLERLKAALADRYTIERELGSGGMATVYLARDVRHERNVAVKVLRPELASVLGPDRFLREIRIAANLHHPHVLPLYDSGEADGFLYYVMPFEEGQSLREKLAKQGELPIAEAVRLLRDVVDALTHAHKHGVVHRDIKPDNVLLAERHALVTDFGVAKAVSEATGRDKLTTAGVALGTPAYMAPEQASADPHIDHRADIYAVGALAYEMLTGRPPFVGATPQAVLAAHVTEAVEPVTKHRDTVPPALEQLVMKCLEKKAADRWQSADDLLPQLEALATPSGGVTPTATQPVSVGLLRTKGRVLVGAAAVLLVLMIGAIVLRPRPSAVLDPDVLAVAPFDVLDPELAMWREGLADVLSHSLDGAGTLRVIPPSVVIRHWEGRADAASAAALGAATGAGYVAYGRLVGAGEDSVRVAATLYDAEAQTAAAEFEVRELADRMDRLADTLALQLVADLSSRRPIGVWHLASLGSTSPAAIKAFLQGEQQWRRFGLDSAQMYYERAIALDSSFALAYSRLSWIAGWELSGEQESLGLRAGALNHGLARRESLALLTDSLYEAAWSMSLDTASWTRFERLFSTAETAAREYPLDPQSWYRLGEVRYHWGRYRRVADELATEAFQRVVELDSGFAPAYPHLIQLTLESDGPSAARNLTAAYLDRFGDVPGTGDVVVLHALLDPARSSLQQTEEMLAALSRDEFFSLAYAVRNWPDSAQTAVRVTRAWAKSQDSVRGQRYLAHRLLHRGHLREAYEVGLGSVATHAEAARLNVVPRDSAAALFESWLRDRSIFGIYYALGWWARQRDTTSLDRAADVWDSVLVASPPADSGGPSYVLRATAGYRSLAAGDTAQAAATLAALPVLPFCGTCYSEHLLAAQLLSASGEDAQAVDVLSDMPSALAYWDRSGAVAWALERARVNDRLGNRARAIEDYSYVVDAWRNADPELQPIVDEARSALARLTAEPRD
jgi:serine/threonine-protein kinase